MADRPTQVNGVTTVQLTRAFDTGDGEDRTLSIDVPHVRVVVAYSADNSDTLR